jgi:flavin reductase (DIM6/NTAB) family NADH-FMN oxidoreductase RutF
MTTQNTISFDPAQCDSKTIYRLMIGAIVPRPIAFVSTISPDGRGNLAPFSFFNGVSSRPPALMIAITRKKGGEKKDSLINIEANGEFVVQTVSESIASPMNQTSADYPYGVDEMKKVGLTPVPSVKIRPVRVQEALIHFECKLLKTVEVGDGGEGSSTLVIGEIVWIHLAPEVYVNGHISAEVLKPLARMAGSQYTTLGSLLEIPRPTLIE